MARKLKGSVAYDLVRKIWRARITLSDGARPWIDVPGDLPNNERGELRAKEWAEEKAKTAREKAMVAADFGMRRRKKRAPASDKPSADESYDAWHARYLKVHERLGRSVRDMRGSGEKWVGSKLGSTPMRSLKREDIVRVRDAISAAVLAGEIGAKRAMNIWSDLVVAPFSRGFTDDDPHYAEVRLGPSTSNPAANVKPPVTREQLDADRRERQPMFPREFSQLVSCPEIPIRARRLYVLAAYLYLRPQELYALRWTDVDWEAREVRIRRKLDVRSGKEKAGTKSEAGIREVPIHPSLFPLLRAMHEERTADDARIVPQKRAARSFERFADQTREHMRLAKIERVELIDGSPDLMPFDFRSFRTTGCTWLAMLGTDSYVVALQAGHKSPDVTWGSYIKRGPDLRKRHGEPFPAVPADLLSRLDPEEESSSENRPAKQLRKSAERAGFEPAVGF